MSKKLKRILHMVYISYKNEVVACVRNFRYRRRCDNNSDLNDVCTIDAHTGEHRRAKRMFDFAYIHHRRRSKIIFLVFAKKKKNPTILLSEIKIRECERAGKQERK